MTRAILIGLLVGSLCFALIYIGAQWDSKQDIQKELDTKNAIDDAQNACPDNLPWHERVLKCL